MCKSLIYNLMISSFDFNIVHILFGLDTIFTKYTNSRFEFDSSVKAMAHIFSHDQLLKADHA